MAFVPELDDPSKDASAPTDDSSDISSQASTTNIAAAPSVGGQSAAGGQVAAPSKSSGSFQDFSKFKAANQGKLSALSNLATEQAKGGVDKAKSAFDTAGSAFQSEIQKNAKNFETSQYAKLNKDSAIDADAISADLSQGPVDSGIQQGQLAGSQEYNQLKSKTDQVQKLGSRAGTSAVLNDYNSSNGNQASAAASNQDALLLQSMGDYRNKANQLAQNTKGTDANALAAQQKILADTSASVNSTNKIYKDKALAALGGLQGTLETDLTDRAKAAEALRMTGIQGQATSASKGAAEAARLQAKKAAMDAFTDYANNPNAPDSAAKYQKVMDAQAESDRRAGVSDSEAIKGTQFADPINLFMDQSSAGKIDENAIYRDDKTRQSQLTALQQLLSGKGKTYNAGALNPLESTALSPLEQLIQQVQNQKPIQQSDAITRAATNVPSLNPVVLPVGPDNRPVSAGGTVKTGPTKQSTSTNR